MNTFQLLITCILVFSLLTFSVLFGHIPSLRNSPVGWINYGITSLLPSCLATLDRVISGGRLSAYVATKSRRVMHERHPSVLVMYLVLFLGGVYIFTTRLLPQLARSHLTVIPVMIAAPLYTLYKAANTDPGYITATNHAHYLEKYSYDGVLFRSGHECTTCLRLKPYTHLHGLEEEPFANLR